LSRKYRLYLKLANIDLVELGIKKSDEIFPLRGAPCTVKKAHEARNPPGWICGRWREPEARGVSSLGARLNDKRLG
jgi:hypothetical protein